MSQLLKTQTVSGSGPLNGMPWVEGTTRIFGVIAHPADHVRAPLVFNPRFAAAGLPHVMVPIDAPPIRLEAIITGLRAIPNFGGLAVTIPHKMALADLCDTLGTAAELTGAVHDAAVLVNGDEVRVRPLAIEVVEGLPLLVREGLVALL